MKIWLPLAILLSVGWLLLVAVVISRGDDGARPTPPIADDAAVLLRQSQAAMRELDSFQVEWYSPWEGRVVSYRIAWQSPDSFHVLYPALSEESSSENPEPVITDNGVYEAIAVEDSIYVRQCVKEGVGCQPWQVTIRGDVYVPTIAPELEPFWPIELLGLMPEPHILGEEVEYGIPYIHVQGGANVVQAMANSWRRAEKERGSIYWGEECSSTTSEPGAERKEDCHETSLDEYIAMHEESLHDQDENPLSVALWIRRDDNLLGILGFAVVGRPTAEGGWGTVRFSRFNEVSVEAPN